MIYIGIDPGITGGIAALYEDGGIKLLEPMPTEPSPVPKRRMVSGRHLASLLPVGSPVMAAVEQVGARPGQSVVAMFSFGQSVGTVLGVLGARGVSYQFVHPQKWQKHHSLSSDKKQTMGWAMRRWPDLTLRAKDDGLADALAIAEWLRTTRS